MVDITRIYKIYTYRSDLKVWRFHYILFVFDKTTAPSKIRGIEEDGTILNEFVFSRGIGFVRSCKFLFKCQRIIISHLTRTCILSGLQFLRGRNERSMKA
jgi:hypothetical protein